MKENALLLGTLFEQPSLFVRLKEELIEAACEFRKDPRAYLAAALKSTTAGGSRRKVLLQFGVATGIACYAVAFAAILIFWSVTHRSPPKPSNVPIDIVRVFLPSRMDRDIESPKDEDRAGGGGGGGNKTTLPYSEGEPPISSLREQVMAPSPKPPVNEPLLAMIETIKVDSRINLRQDDLAPTGLRDGVPGPPEAGPGSDGGMGTGSKGGMGPGNGAGLGPGNGWNTNDGNPHTGRLRAPSDSEQKPVDTRPVALNRPRPNYTEAARQNKIQGVIRARVLVGADGSVQKVVIVSPLPDGLNEEAITAVSQMRFRAATRGGQSVAFWVSLEVEFNLR